MFGRRRTARQYREAWQSVEELSATHVEPPLAAPAQAREQVAGLMMLHPQPLVIDGQVRTCDGCGAYRDWIVISIHCAVWLRCPAGHEQPEPRLDTAWYDQHSGPITHQYDSYEDGLRHLGH
ncbi:hypothetical protein [Streptomyces sp. CC208A]|uniref:hypothetical protein n=1 Tax=Streptomyces sp. CC208A TaxID=3044573 RepID=UPI0024A96FC5|nr:hypothetical protein [Streptomyces sp. CC208A]